MSSSQVFINESGGSDAIVNITTTSTTLSRPSSYRKNYGVEFSGFDLEDIFVAYFVNFTIHCFTMYKNLLYIKYIEELNSLGI